MQNRDYLKKKAYKFVSENQWDLYNICERLRNTVNRETKSAYICQKIKDCKAAYDPKSS